MRNKKTPLIQVLFACTCLLVLIGLSACPPPERFEGTYVALESETSPHSGAVIELNENSQGIFQSQDQEVSFRWTVRGHEIRFHTKEGGIVQGEIQNDTLTVTLPSGRVMTFQKESPY